MNKNRIIGFFCFLFLIAQTNVAGQQFLWTTNSNGMFAKSDFKVISIDDVSEKLLEYYELYDNYYDISGFSKDGFFKKFESSISYKYSDKAKWIELKKAILNEKNISISCLKFNEGNSSSVMVYIITKDNFDAIKFSNTSEQGRISTYNSNSDSEKQRFIKFYNSLIGASSKSKVVNNSSSKEVNNEEINHNIIPAEFPGGLPAWAKFLERNLNRKIPEVNGAPSGKYSVTVSFTVDKNGGISEVQAENNPGYGTVEEAVRVIKSGPSWKPAVEGGRNIVFRQKCDITFLVSEK